jgi:hypothetical protein
MFYRISELACCVSRIRWFSVDLPERVKRAVPIENLNSVPYDFVTKQQPVKGEKGLNYAQALSVPRTERSF